MLSESVYQFKVNRRSRYLRLSVYDDGRIVVTAPFGFQRSAVKDFVKSRQAWIAKKLKLFRQQRFFSPSCTSSASDYLANKEAARVLVKERLEFYNQFYGFSFGRVAIKNNRTRWGSCSRSGNLNFHYKIISLPAKLRDYIIVHELCHLKEFNHSSRFWQLLAQLVPDYADLRRKLKVWGRELA